MTKILVVEDKSESREMFIECLEAEGFNAIGAENGLIGVQRAQEVLPDLVICDIVMPELDGYEVLSMLRQNPVTAIIPFIFLTAKSTKEELRYGMKLGADDYLTKPITVEEILAAIAARLEKQAALKQWYVALSQLNAATEPAEVVESVNSESFFPDCAQLTQVFDYIEANYHEPIGLDDVALAVGYSAAYLTDLARRQTGQPLHRWIIRRRMAAACSLLLETDQSIEQIAEAVGYRYTGCFFRQFRISFGTTPQVWRKAQRIQAIAN